MENKPLQLFLKSKLIHAGFLRDSDFAKKISVSKSFYSQISSGKRTPSYSSLLKIKNELRLSSDDLVQLIKLITETEK